jgi:tetratricopeptide (TPR) repeat protein
MVNLKHAVPICTLLALAGCADVVRIAGFNGTPPAQEDTRDHFAIAQRLAASGEHDPALRAYLRAALEQGMTSDVLTGLGSSNLALGRLGQAEDQLRLATRRDPANIAAWNNLGVLLMEKGEPGPARGVFQHLVTLEGGDAPEIRSNLELAIARSQTSAYTPPEAGDYVLIRKGGGVYRLSPAKDGPQG